MKERLACADLGRLVWEPRSSLLGLSYLGSGSVSVATVRGEDQPDRWINTPSLSRITNTNSENFLKNSENNEWFMKNTSF